MWRSSKSNLNHALRFAVLILVDMPMLTPYAYTQFYSNFVSAACG
jgi:hypothetical protein